MSEREAAWAELHAATPPGWWVGSPSHHTERSEWLLYAFDPSERAVVGVCQREWQALADSEVAVSKRRSVRSCCRAADRASRDH